MKKILCLVLSLIMVFPLMVSANSQGNAEMLKALDLFKGTDKGFELEREASRVEAIVTVVRILGAEAEALDKKYSHSFEDTDSWMDPYVGYALEKGITKGVSEKEFAPNDLITETQFITLVLRAMEYSDAKGDFNWEKSVVFAETLGIKNAASSSFKRGNMVDICFSALTAPVKSGSKLYEKLADNGVFTKEKFAEVTGVSEKYVPKAEIAEVKNDRNGIFTVTLDDGVYDHAYKMNNFAKKYGFKFTSYIPTKTAQGAEFSTSAWNALLNEGRMSVGNHGYTHVKINDLSDEEYYNETVKAMKDMKMFFPNTTYLTYATPFTGAVDRYDVVKEVIYANRSSSPDGLNSVSPKQAQMFNLGSYIIRNNLDPAVPAQHIKTAYEKNLWYIQMWHGFDGGEYCPPTETAEIFFKELNAYKDKMWFATMDEAVKYIYEKQNAQLKVEGDEKVVKVTLTDTLDNKKFDMPLTVKVSAPQAAVSATVTVNGKKKDAEVKNGYVIFDLIPDKETAEIKF